MRLKAKTDLNQTPIVQALRAIGASVLILAQVGKGCPDLLVGYRGQNFLLEVKHGNGKLTADQVEFFAAWQGQVYEVRSAVEAVDVLLNDVRKIPHAV
jgi:hypothetical protein